MKTSDDQMFEHMFGSYEDEPKLSGAAKAMAVFAKSVARLPEPFVALLDGGRMVAFGGAKRAGGLS